MLQRIDPKKWADDLLQGDSDRVAMEAIVALCKTNRAAAYRRGDFRAACITSRTTATAEVAIELPARGATGAGPLSAAAIRQRPRHRRGFARHVPAAG